MLLRNATKDENVLRPRTSVTVGARTRCRPALAHIGRKACSPPPAPQLSTRFRYDTSRSQFPSPINGRSATNPRAPSNAVSGQCMTRRLCVQVDYFRAGDGSLGIQCATSAESCVLAPA
jgi:hypothetical protein